MKKLALLLALTVAIVWVASPVMAQSYPGRYVKTEVVDAGAAGAATVSTYVKSNQKLLGFLCGGTTAGEVALYDSVTTNVSGKRTIAENTHAANVTNSVIFPYPRELTYGVAVTGPAADNYVVLYYE